MPENFMPKLKRVFSRILKNFRFLLSRDIRDIDDQSTQNQKQIKEQSQQIKEQSQQIKEQSQENLFLLKTCFDRDPWLAKSKDLHKGERCFLLGCGPSLNKVDLSLLKGQHIMGVNGTILIDTIELEYFVSVSNYWWKQHIEPLIAHRCKRRFLPLFIDGIDSDCPTTWLRVIDIRHHRRLTDANPWFFSTEADRYVVLGGSVIIVCLQILYHLGFSEVVILGLDHDYGFEDDKLKKKGGMYLKSENIVAHFTNDYYPVGVDVHLDIGAMERGYQLAHDAFINDGRKILNASPGTKLEIFPKVEYNLLF